MILVERVGNPRALAAIYTAADVLCNPTREDNYPTVNLEAQACGTPVVSYNSGGSPETLWLEGSVACSNISDLIRIVQKKGTARG